MTDDDELRFDGLWETRLKNRWAMLSRMSPEDRAKDVARAAYKLAAEYRPATGRDKA